MMACVPRYEITPFLLELLCFLSKIPLPTTFRFNYNIEKYWKILYLKAGFLWIVGFGKEQFFLLFLRKKKVKPNISKGFELFLKFISYIFIF